MKIEQIQPLEIDKFRELREIFIETFKESAEELAEQQYSMLSDNRYFIAAVAVVGFKIVGGFMAHIVPNYFHGGYTLFIDNLAVKREHQRKRIGTALLDYARDFCLDRHIKEMYITAEIDNIGGRNFHKMRGGKEKVATIFVYSFK